MKPSISYIAALLTFLAASSAALAQTPSAGGSSVPIETLSATNRVGLSYRMGFNISARFKNLGGFTMLTEDTNPLRTPNGRGYSHDNGYIFPDAAQPPDYTYYYGYELGTRVVSPPGLPGSQFDLSRSSSPADVTSRDNSGDPQHGMEVTYSRRFGAAGRGSWGLEAGLGFTDVSIGDGRTYRGTAVRMIDTYQTPVGPLPSAPFYGTFEGPLPGDETGQPLVGLEPVASSNETLDGGATIRGHRQFDAAVVGLRFGPYLDIPLAESWNFSFGVGLALLQVNSDFSFNESVSIDPSFSVVGLPSQTRRGSGSQSDVVIGGYVGGRFSYEVNEQVSLFAGAQFQFAEDYTHREAGKKAILNLGESVFLSLGFDFSF